MPPSERVVKIGGESHRVRIKPYEGGTLAVIDGGELVDIVGRWEPGQRLLSVDRRRPPPDRPGRRAGRDWELQTRGATPQGAGAAAARRRAVEAHDREGRRPTCRGCCSRRCRGC